MSLSNIVFLLFCSKLKWQCINGLFCPLFYYFWSIVMILLNRRAGAKEVFSCPCVCVWMKCCILNVQNHNFSRLWLGGILTCIVIFIKDLLLPSVSLLAKSAFWLKKVSTFCLVSCEPATSLSHDACNNVQSCLTFFYSAVNSIYEDFVSFTGWHACVVDRQLAHQLNLIHIAARILSSPFFMFMTCMLFYRVNVSNWILSHFSSFVREVGRF